MLVPIIKKTTQPNVNRHRLTRQVNELYDTFNEIAEMLGKDKLTQKKPIVQKQELPKVPPYVEPHVQY